MAKQTIKTNNQNNNQKKTAQNRRQYWICQVQYVQRHWTLQEREAQIKMKIDEYNIDRYQWEKLIDLWIFNERDRAILKRRLLDGVCYEPLAEEFDLTARQVQKIVYKSQNKLIRHIRAPNNYQKND